jgi:hypothetical protein
MTWNILELMFSGKANLLCPGVRVQVNAFGPISTFTVSIERKLAQFKLAREVGLTESNPSR